MSIEDNSREDILKAALRLFTKKGYFNTSLEDIKKVTGASTRTIYHSFSSKEEIARVLYRDIIDSVNHSVDEIRHIHKTATERTHSIVDLLFTLTEQIPEALEFILFMRPQEFPSEQNPIGSSLTFDKLRKILVEGMELGEIREMDPTLAFVCFYGVVIKAIQLRLEGKLNKPLDHYTDEIWRTAWRSISAL